MLLLLSPWTPVASAQVSDGARLASDHGCLNCHCAGSKSSPTLESLTKKAADQRDGTDAVQHLLDEMHEKSAVTSHRRVSDPSALAILRWMAQGAH
ncbi:hypothetical protein [Ideonella sp. A 288]|uniref:hypothetical protein n=1 Tax=Ideonella sp. A 288 TaxID=1962181 RepID=UPI000B4BF9A1|nr:hypothetical protein [Ideonella sp. A 288]